MSRVNERPSKLLEMLTMKSSVDLDTLNNITDKSLQFSIFPVIFVEPESALSNLLIIEFLIVSILDVAGIRLDNEADFGVCLVGSNLVHLVNLFRLLRSISLFSTIV